MAENALRLMYGRLGFMSNMANYIRDDQGIDSMDELRSLDDSEGENDEGNAHPDFESQEDEFE
jgi:hypothetical protein